MQLDLEEKSTPQLRGGANKEENRNLIGPVCAGEYCNPTHANPCCDGYECVEYGFAHALKIKLYCNHST